MNANKLAETNRLIELLRQQQAEIRDLQQQVAFLEDYRAVWAPVIRQHQGLDK